MDVVPIHAGITFLFGLCMYAVRESAYYMGSRSYAIIGCIFKKTVIWNADKIKYSDDISIKYWLR